MKKENAYFQLIIKENEVWIKLMPSVNAGEALDVNEVKEYLEKNNILDYNLKDLSDAIYNYSSPLEVFLANISLPPVHEMMELKVSDDKMSVVARFYAPSNLGSRMSKNDIMIKLNGAKIKFGIKEEVIQSHLEFPNYCEELLIAEGAKPVEGKDAYITYYFAVDLKAKPKLNEDGTVDFHQLNNISHIKAGDILAKLTPEVPGTSGRDVFGNELRPRKVSRKVLKFGKNITLSDDFLTISSNIDGHASLIGDRIYVYSMFEVPADVDNSTGDIDYEGDIYIKGNVRTGFKIRAAGNIEINGVVEAAEVRAGGNIILRRGIQGMGKGLLECKGNLFAKFIESSTVVVDGDIQTECILHSNVSAEGEIIVQGNRGCLIGGHVRSSTLIQAKTIGSAMGTATIVEVGTNPKLKDKLSESHKLMQSKNIELHKLRQVCELLVRKNEMGQLDREKKQMLIKVIQNINLLKEEIEILRKDSVKVSDNLSVYHHACIKVTGEVYPGVKLVILDEFALIQSVSYHCLYKMKDGEIVSVPL